MKWFLFCFLLFNFIPCNAEDNDEQVLYTEDQACAIHYLTTKTKKLWTIDVDKNYCKDGWVNGFATVIVKDALNRTAHTLKGFFYQGYCLSDFPGRIKTFNRLTPKQNIQDFIFNIQTDNQEESEFYMVATATQTDGSYTVFEICPKDPVLLAVHEPVTDFGQSLFQTHLLDQTQTFFKQKCPLSKKFTLIGGSSQILLEKDGPFRANIDSSSQETTLSYTSPIPLKEKLQPTELRHESSEHLITIHPEKTPQKEIEISKIDNTPSPSEQNIIETSSQTRSAIDLALLAQVLQTPIQGKTAVYIDTEMASSPIITKPLSLTLQSTQPVTKGWNLITGIFTAQSQTTDVQILLAKPCLKEWCIDEN